MHLMGSLGYRGLSELIQFSLFLLEPNILQEWGTTGTFKSSVYLLMILPMPGKRQLLLVTEIHLVTAWG